MKTHLHINLLAASVLLVFCCSGCSQEERLVLSDASLKGKISYKGKPVPHALVVVMGEGSSATANADAEGNYIVEHVPAGEVKIGVNSDAGRGMMMGAVMASAQTGDKSAKPTFVDVPKKYFDPNTSGITTNIADSKGANVFNVDIK
jgi:hypothetical protein